MNLDLITRNQLEVLNKQGQRYHLQDAEKDYFLAVILKIIYSSHLKDALIFKGGTAIYHCYLEQLRFSKDLDFTAVEKVTGEAIERVFSKYDFLKVKALEEKKYSLDFSLQYRGILTQPDTIAININTNQKVLLPYIELPYRNSYNVDVSCLCMDVKEIIAEKIRTLNERARPRDLYDLVILNRTFDINFKEVIALLQNKELHKLIEKNRMKDNLRVSRERFDDEMRDLYYREAVDKKEIERLAAGILKEI